MTTATLTRKASGTSAPTIPAQRTRRATGAPERGTWVIDPNRAVVAFSGKASFLAPTISARFTGVDGRVEVAELSSSVVSGAVQVTVDVTSMTTGNAVYDELIKAADPFEAKRFPLAVYRSTGVSWSDGSLGIDGSLTLRGITKQVPLQASYVVGRAGDRMIVRAAGSVDRSAFGIAFDIPGCGKLVPKVMKLEIDVDVVRSA